MDAPTVTVRPQATLKLVVIGPHGGGAGSFVDAASELSPAGPPGWEFGRRTINATVVYLFGLTHARWWLVWRGMLAGARAVIVVTTTARLTEAFPALDAAQGTGLPYVVLINRFGEVERHHPDQIRAALSVDATVPVLACNTRDRGSVTAALTAVVAHLTAQSR
jgi:signal recognition particle receptor subunit beta